MISLIFNVSLLITNTSTGPWLTVTNPSLEIQFKCIELKGNSAFRLDNSTLCMGRDLIHSSRTTCLRFCWSVNIKTSLLFLIMVNTKFLFAFLQSFLK